MLYTGDIEVAGECEQHGANGCTQQQSRDRPQVGGVACWNHCVEDEFVGHRGKHTQQYYDEGRQAEHHSIGARDHIPDKVDKVLDVQGT